MEKEIYPELSACVSRTEKGALKALEKALKWKQKLINRAMDDCEKAVKKMSIEEIIVKKGLGICLHQNNAKSS